MEERDIFKINYDTDNIKKNLYDILYRKNTIDLSPEYLICNDKNFDIIESRFKEIVDNFFKSKGFHESSEDKIFEIDKEASMLPENLNQGKIVMKINLKFDDKGIDFISCYYGIEKYVIEELITHYKNTINFKIIEKDGHLDIHNLTLSEFLFDEIQKIKGIV